MSEDKTQEKPYVLEPFEKDGQKGTLIKTADGNPLFSVDDTFTEAQIDVVFQLCDAFFKNGVEVAVNEHQANFRRLVGLTPEGIKMLLDSLETPAK